VYFAAIKILKRGKQVARETSRETYICEKNGEERKEKKKRMLNTKFRRVVISGCREGRRWRWGGPEGFRLFLAGF